jgi:DNA-binding NarL/FixJ family response regulator
VRLLGREGETAALERALADVGAGGQRLLAISGEAGIGKSALLDHAAARAGEAGMLVLAARAAEHEQDVPFGLVVDALDDHVATFGPARLASLAPELEAVLPAVAAGSDTPPAAPSAIPWERFRLHRALRGLLEQLGRERPLALLLDDLQWADEATIELLLHLLRRPPRVPLLLVLALRPGRVPRLLDAGRRAHGWEELRLAPLAHATAGALLPDGLDAAARERILREAGGNPLFLRELARDVVAGGSRGGRGDAGEPVPPTLADAIAHDLDALDETAAAFAHGAAVAGDPFELDVAVAASDLDEDAAVAALDRLVAAGLVQPAAASRSFGFRHPLVHRVVADAVPPGWRMRAHARAAALLERRAAPPAVRAGHVERYAAPGDEAAIALFRAAAAEALSSSPAAAAHWYEAALRLLPHGDDARRADLLEPLGLALASCGRLDDSRAAIDDCIALLGPGEADRRVALIATVTVGDVLRGEFGVAEERLRRALEEAPPRRRPRLLHYRASVAFYKGDAAGIASWSEQAARALDALDGEEAELLAAASASQGALGRALLGEPAAAEIERAAARLEGVGDDVLAGQLDAVWTIGGNLAQVERYAAAAPVLRRGMRLARETRQGHLLLHFHSLLALVELPLLELDAALEHAETAEEGARLQGRGYDLGFALTQRARVLAARGQQAEAEQAAAESDALFGARDARSATVTGLIRSAVVRLERDPERLLSELVAIAGPRLERLNTTILGGVLLVATRAAIAAGRLDEAARWVDQGSAVASLDMPASRLRVVQADAELRLAQGDGAAAARLAEAAAGDAQRAGLRQEQLGAELLHGRALLTVGERDAALERLQSVAATAGRLGAFALRDEAARELRRAGARISMGARRAADAAGRVGLTERELAVAELVARGHSNKQVAAALFLSEKTVERHLSHVYAKLGLRARTELAAALG